MATLLVCGLEAGLAFMFWREHLNASGQAQTWTTINNLLFQDITAEGAERAFWHLLHHRPALHQGTAAGDHPHGLYLHFAGHWQHCRHPHHGPHFRKDPVLVPAVLLPGAAAGRLWATAPIHGPVHPHRGSGRSQRFHRFQPLERGAEHHPSNIITAFGSNGVVLPACSWQWPSA